MSAVRDRPQPATVGEETSSPTGAVLGRWRSSFGWVDARWFDPLGLVGIVLFLLFWWWLSTQMPPSRLVSPQDVFQDIRDNFYSAPRLAIFGLSDAGYWPLLQYTIRNVATGVAVGGLIGLILGLLSARSWLFRAILDPVMLVLGTVPVLIAAPFFVIWFGVLSFTQVLLVGFYSAIILLIFGQRAAQNLDPVYERWAGTFGASHLRQLRTVLLPGTVPEILGGFRIALAGAWGLETFAELLGARDGIGQAIAALANVSNAPGLLACVVLVSLAAVVIDAALVVASAWITRWK